MPIMTLVTVVTKRVFYTLYFLTGLYILYKRKAFKVECVCWCMVNKCDVILFSFHNFCKHLHNLLSRKLIKFIIICIVTVYFRSPLSEQVYNRGRNFSQLRNIYISQFRLHLYLYRSVVHEKNNCLISECSCSLIFTF